MFLWASLSREEGVRGFMVDTIRDEPPTQFDTYAIFNILDVIFYIIIMDL